MGSDDATSDATSDAADDAPGPLFSPETFEDAGRRALKLLSRYVSESRRGQVPVFRLRPVGEIAEQLGLRRRLRDGNMDAEGFESFLELYLESTTRLHHPGYASHQVAVTDHPTALADLINGVTNNGMAIYEMGSGAVAIELTVLDWMLEKIGWPRSRWPGDLDKNVHGAGVLTHGGSLATLTALLAARGRICPEAWEDGVPDDLVVLAPPSSHYAIARAVSIMGLGSRAIRPLAVDHLERIVAERVPEAIRDARACGKRVVALVANACATASGLHDRLDSIGRHCREAGVWFHVDGAHGASALVSSREREHLRGIEAADSLVWDAHKMLRVSSLCAAVLFRAETSFDHLFRQQASYLFYGENAEGVDLIHRTVECTKLPLGLKLFLNLAWRGERGMARYVEGQYAATRRFHRRISERDGFECACEPESNVLCFRYGRSDARQIAIKQRVIREGAFHIGSAELGGARYLRLTVMNPATDDATIDALLDAIVRIAGEI